MSRLRLGIVGESPGNGHPYSWAAIFNGYDADVMASCPYPTIPAYLARPRFPDDFLASRGTVTHVWTESPGRSEHIARASRVPVVAESLEELLSAVDAVLFARDDAEERAACLDRVLASGLPVFVDKPLALRERDARALLDHRVLSCSALRFAPEIRAAAAAAVVGEIASVEAVSPKSWDLYGVHLVEPIVADLAAAGRLGADVRSRSRSGSGGARSIEVVLADGFRFSARTTGDAPSGLSFVYSGARGRVELSSIDVFACFRASLDAFVDTVHRRGRVIDDAETLAIVRWIEYGRGEGP